MTGWKCSAVILLFALVLPGAAPQSPGYAAYERANELLVAKKLPAALSAVDEALRLDPKLVPALTLKAKLAMAAYQLDVATQCLERALAISPRAAYAQLLYGLVAYLGNDLKEALPRFRNARALNPADPRAALYLGLTVESLGEPEEAMSQYAEAVRLAQNTGELESDTLLPGIRLLLLLDRLEEGERWIRQAESLSPNSRDVHFEFGRLLLKKGDAMRAAEQGETALRCSGGVVTDAAIHYLLIRAYANSGRTDKAAFHAQVMRSLEAPANSKAKN